MLQKAFDLTRTVLESTKDLVLRRGSNGEWAIVVFLMLARTSQSLDAVKLLLNHGLYNPAIVVTRCIFEDTVNLKYIKVNVKERLPVYLKHGRVPGNAEEAAELIAEIQSVKNSGEFSAGSEAVPKIAWKKMNLMCEEIGWSEHYQTMYRLTSDNAHSGALTLTGELSRLLTQEPRPEWQSANVMTTALIYHLEVVTIAAEELQINDTNPETLKYWHAQLETFMTAIGDEAKKHVAPTEADGDCPPDQWPSVSV